MLKCPKCEKDFKDYAKLKRRSSARVICPSCRTISMPTKKSYNVLNTTLLVIFISFIISLVIVERTFELGNIIKLIAFLGAICMYSIKRLMFLKIVELEEC